jgi:tetratricopeptide (TPR) repeat protein
MFCQHHLCRRWSKDAFAGILMGRSPNMAAAENERLFAQALKAGKNRDYLKASTLLLRIVSETDEIPQAFLYLGRSYHALGNYDLAIQFLKYFTEILPDVGAGHFFLGRAYLSRNLPGKATDELSMATKMDPENPHAFALLGLSCLKIKRPDMGTLALGRAVELDPENKELYTAYRNALLVDAVRLYRLNDLDQAREMFTFLLEAGFEGPLPALYLAALERASGRYDEALRWYDRAVFHATDDPLIHLQRAGVLYLLGRKADALEIFAAFGMPAEEDDSGLNAGDVDRFIAEESFQKNHFRKAVLYAKRVIQRQGRNYDMHMLLGESFRNLESHTKAKNHFTRAHELDRNRVEPLYGIAMVLWQRGQWNEMLDYLSRIEVARPGDAVASYYRALCLCKLGEAADDVMPDIQDALRKNEPDEYLATALGNEYLKSDRPDLASNWFEKALGFAPAHREAHQGIIRAFESLDDSQNEMASYRTYLERYPTDLPMRTSFVHLLLGAKEYMEATEQIQTALTYGNEDSELARLLAFCYRKTGQFREAAVVYRSLLKAEPKNEDHLRSLCFCLESLGNRHTAVLLLARATDYFPPSPELRLIYGVLLFKDGDLEKALEQFRAVLMEHSNDWRALKNIALIYRMQGIEDFAEKFLAQAEKHRPSTHTGLVDAE